MRERKETFFFHHYFLHSIEEECCVREMKVTKRKMENGNEIILEIKHFRNKVFFCLSVINERLLIQFLLKKKRIEKKE